MRWLRTASRQAARGDAMSIPLAALEEIIDTSGIAPRIELLPIGVRHRQLRVRTLLAGMMLSQADQRPAHLTRVRDALTALPGPDQVPARRLGGLEDRPAPAHLPADRAHLRTRLMGLAPLMLWLTYRLNSTVYLPSRPAARRFPTRRRLRACGWRAGQECVVMYPMTVAASGLSAYRSESGSSSVVRHRWYFGS